jgi:hypothetical protein
MALAFLVSSSDRVLVSAAESAAGEKYVTEDFTGFAVDFAAGRLAWRSHSENGSFSCAWMAAVPKITRQSALRADRRIGIEVSSDQGSLSFQMAARRSLDTTPASNSSFLTIVPLEEIWQFVTIVLVKQHLDVCADMMILAAVRLRWQIQPEVALVESQ